jgi:hypothetical protein
MHRVRNEGVGGFESPQLHRYHRSQRPSPRSGKRAFGSSGTKVQQQSTAVAHLSASSGSPRAAERRPGEIGRDVRVDLLLRLQTMAPAGRGHHQLARRLRLRHRLPAQRRGTPTLPTALPRFGHRLGLRALPGQQRNLRRRTATQRPARRHSPGKLKTAPPVSTSLTQPPGSNPRRTHASLH